MWVRRVWLYECPRGTVSGTKQLNSNQRLVVNRELKTTFKNVLEGEKNPQNPQINWKYGLAAELESSGNKVYLIYCSWFTSIYNLILFLIPFHQFL